MIFPFFARTHAHAHTCREMGETLPCLPFLPYPPPVGKVLPTPYPLEVSSTISVRPNHAQFL